jgi:hypothetical protein
MTQGLSVLTGASAGVTESFVVVPFELVKIRLQDRASAGKYNGPLDVVSKIIKNEGILAMYQGMESTMWRHASWNAGYFGVIFQVRGLLPQAETKKAKITNDIIAGTIGGTVGTAVSGFYSTVQLIPTSHRLRRIGASGSGKFDMPPWTSPEADLTRSNYTMLTLTS